MNTQREGWLADGYVRLYAPSARGEISSLYAFNEFLPSCALWGSWGLDALCLGPDGKLYRIPWISLSEAHRKEAYTSVQALEKALSALHEATPEYEHFGKEIHFITPLVFGGSPKDSANLAMVDQRIHAEACCFWNRVYARHKATGT